MQGNELKGDLKLVAAVAVATALFARTPLWGLFSWAISCPFHETGHAMAAWLTSRTAIPTPFRAIVFSEQREIWFFLLQVAGCYWIWKRGREEEEGGRLLIGFAWVWVGLLVFCTFLLDPLAREQFMIWAGQAGELALAAAAVSGVPLPTAELLREQHLAAIADGFGEKDWAALGAFIARKAGLG
jgi:hypothetical protein